MRRGRQNWEREFRETDLGDRIIGEGERETELGDRIEGDRIGRPNSSGREGDRIGRQN